MWKNSLNINDNSAVFRYIEEVPSQQGKNYLVSAFLQYPRLFNADNLSKLNFEIKKSDEVYFEFKNFNNLSSTPILYDLNNNVVVNPTGSIYKIGTVTSSSIRNFRITATYTLVIKIVLLNLLIKILDVDRLMKQKFLR